MLPKLREVFNISEANPYEPKRPAPRRSGGINNVQDAMDTTVSKEEARQEILRHQSDFNEFLKDVGDKPNYKGEEVLHWLGY